ncbi:MAG: hypothetical protein CME88_06790 [Hirschia sp.]|nr:hypothetical protein [Hirschia sp.]MBF18068.1 hypothetical protein [Hirschia sp.]
MLLNAVLKVHVRTALTRFSLIIIWSLALFTVAPPLYAGLWSLSIVILALFLGGSQAKQARVQDINQQQQWLRIQRLLKLVYASAWAIPPALALWSPDPNGVIVGLGMVFGGMLVLVANYGVVPRRLLLESTIYFAVMFVFLVTHWKSEAFLALLAISVLLLVVCADSTNVLRKTGMQLMQTQRDLEAANERAEAINRSRTAFIADLNHEIRTPLNGVLGLATALNQTQLSIAQKEMVSLIETSGETLERLLSDLIDLSSIAEGRFELRTSPLNLQDTIAKSADLMRGRAAEKGLDFRIEYGPGTDGIFEGDTIRIRQIVANLTSNAVKFTRSGFVKIRLDALPDAGDDRSRIVTVTVSDSGHGIDEDLQSRLFQRYSQGFEHHENEVRGAGLGLAISLALAKQMDGGISVESELGVGSKFTLSMRLIRSVTPDGDIGTNQKAIARKQSNELKILLVEDHPVNQKVVQQILMPFGSTITLAEDGKAAVEAFSKDQFDLILMDMQMSGLNGLEATQHIRSQERITRQKRTPILMLSAHSNDDYIRLATAAGADDFLAKPVTAEGLIQRISAFANVDAWD